MEIIHGHQVEFNADRHEYFVDGILVPSVSQICKMENPGMYMGVDESVLLNAARKGTNLHKDIEDFEKYGVINEKSLEIRNYITLKARLNIVKQMSERMIIIEHDGRIVCAGRFDLFATVNGVPALVDFKRTYEIHHAYVKLQLNLYRMGLMQCYGETIDQLMVIRLRYAQVELHEVDIDEAYVKRVLDKYKS